MNDITIEIFSIERIAMKKGLILPNKYMDKMPND